MRVQGAVLMGVLLVAGVFAGCISANEEFDEFVKDGVEPSYEDISRHTELEMEYEVETGLHLLEPELVGEGSVELPERASNLTFEVTMEMDLNDLVIVVEDTDGNEWSLDPDDGELEIISPEPVEHTVQVFAQGLVVEDTVQIDIAYDWIQRVFLASEEETDAVEGITLVQKGGEWIAQLVSQASGDADAFDIKTSSGTVNVDRDDTASSTITVTARASDRDLAREALDEAIVTNQVQKSKLTAHATWKPDSHDDRIQRDIEIDVGLPMDTSGKVKTSSGSMQIENLGFGDLELDASSGGITVNDVTADRFEAEASSGSITIDDVTADTIDAKASSGSIDIDATADGFTLDTSSGSMGGTITSGGDVSLDASSGSITLTLKPTKSHKIDADTSSGSITLSLEESSNIAYDLELKASSGRFQESMQEAELEYPDPDDESHAFLRTTDGDDRSIQVSGHIESSSGSHDYRSA